MESDNPPGCIRVRAVWISDLHLGTPGCQARALLDFLRDVHCDTLYLVGDVIDGWQLRRSWYWPQSHNDAVQKILRKARKGTRVIFVPGNHDEFARRYVTHVQLVRPRQGSGERPDRGERFHEVLLRGMPIPRYPSLRMGVPSKRTLVKLWTLQRPEVVHIATEGPLGWSALQAALHLKLPVCSDFRTNFHAYTQHYGVGWLRKFHNSTLCTMVPTDALKRELTAQGFQRLEVVTRWWSLASGAWRARRTWTWSSTPSAPSSGASRWRGWCWWAAGRCRSNCSRPAPARCSPASATARTWRRTTPARTCSSFPA